MAKPKILIVEDDVVIAYLIKGILEMSGFEITDIINNGEDAIINAAANRPDMILMDIKLQGNKDGIETAQQIYEEHSIPFIYITGDEDDTTIKRAIATASYGYIIKPFKVKTIYAAIEMALSKHRLEGELRKRNEELQNLTAYIESVREEERKKIAREIHDYLGQSLTALRIDCSRLMQRAVDAQKEPGTQLKKITSMIELIDETLENVRNICADLRPGILDHLGLTAAVKWQCAEVHKRTGIIFNHDNINNDLPISNDISVSLFRIFQEIVTNIVRHASATEVDVSLTKEGDNVILAVRDNGTGISEQEIKNPRSFGLIGMRERARFYGGTLEINGIRGKGTEVVLSLPSLFLSHDS
jgi:signal transduction histidine kinase